MPARKYHIRGMAVGEARLFPWDSEKPARTWNSLNGGVRLYHWKNPSHMLEVSKTPEGVRVWRRK